MKRILYPLLMIGWVILIFAFSFQPAADSSAVSSGFLRIMLETLLPRLMEKLSAEQQDGLHFLVRKCAHFSEFAVLGMLSALTVSQFEIQPKRWYALGFCVLVACADEMIQLFSWGRSAQVADVLLDSAGAFAGLMFVFKVQSGEGYGHQSAEHTDQSGASAGDS